MAYEVVDDITASIEEQNGRENMPEGENDDEPTELVRVELVDDGEEEREGDVEGREGGDGPGGEGKGGILIWDRMPHVGHGQGKQPPKIHLL